MGGKTFLQHRVQDLHEYPFSSAWLMHYSSCFKRHLPGWDAAHLCITASGSVTHCKHTEKGVHLIKDALILHLFSIDPPVTLMPTNMQQRYFHHRWQEAAAASSEQQMGGRFVYLWSTLVLRALITCIAPALWLRCHSSPQWGWHAGKQWSC